MRKRKRLRASVVISVAGSFAQSVACGGSTTGETSQGSEDAGAGGGPGVGGQDAGAGGAATGGLGPGGAATGGAGSGGVAAGGVGAGGDAVTACPGTWDSGAGEPLCPPSGRCTVDFACASGPETLLVQCGNAAVGWTVSAPCELPFDHCTATIGEVRHDVDCIEDRWILRGFGGNPPAPCPEQAPAVAAACRPGGFGGDPEYCGFRCADGTGWTVLNCAQSGPAVDGGIPPTSWLSDGACGPVP